MNLSALEAKVTSDEGKQELNRLKMALNEAELLQHREQSTCTTFEPADLESQTHDYPSWRQERLRVATALEDATLAIQVWAIAASGLTRDRNKVGRLTFLKIW